MDFGTLREHVSRNLGNRTDIDTLINEWINSAYLDIITIGKLPELGHFAPIPIPELDGEADQATSAGIYEYPKPTNCLFIVTMRDTTNDNPIKQRGFRWFQRYRTTTNGYPGVYATYGGNFYLDPPPSGIFNLDIFHRKKVTVPAMSADTDTPVAGEEWHEAIELAATYRGARSLNHPDKAQWLGDLKAFLAAHSEQFTEEEEDADIGFKIVM